MLWMRYVVHAIHPSMRSTHPSIHPAYYHKMLMSCDHAIHPSTRLLIQTVKSQNHHRKMLNFVHAIDYGIRYIRYVPCGTTCHLYDIENVDEMQADAGSHTPDPILNFMLTTATLPSTGHSPAHISNQLSLTYLLRHDASRVQHEPAVAVGFYSLACARESVDAVWLRRVRNRSSSRLSRFARRYQRWLHSY